jgi:hypothetical protein
VPNILLLDYGEYLLHEGQTHLQCLAGWLSMHNEMSQLAELPENHIFD